jgi:hypothetical protein
VRGFEFIIFFSFLLVPPLLLGLLALALLRQRLARGSSLLKLGAGVLVFSGALALAAVVVGPAWLGRYIGVRDFHLLGAHLSWAPFAFIAVGAAVAVVLALARMRQ